MRRWGAAAVAALIGLAAIMVPPGEPADAAGQVTAGVESVPSPDPWDSCRAPAREGEVREGFPVAASALPASGAPVVQTLYVDFADAVGDPGVIPRFEGDLDEGADLMSRQSSGALQLDRRSHATWLRLPGSSFEYGAGRSEELFAAAVAAADSTVDFSSVDVVWVVWMTAVPLDDMRSQAWNWATAEADGRTLSHAVLLRPADLFPLGGKVVAHESGHTLGLPDLYDTAEEPDGDRFRWTAGWDMMSDDSGPGMALFGWHRWMLGWADDTSVRCVAPGEEATVDLSPLQSDTGTRLATVRLDRSRVLAVESRRAEGLDAGILREGVLVYVVDTSRPTGSGPIEVQFSDDTADPVRDSWTVNNAPLQDGDVYTDPATGVRVQVLSAGGVTDRVRVDAGSLSRDDRTLRTIAAYESSTVDGAYVSPLDLVTHDTGVDVLTLGLFELSDDGVLLNGRIPGNPDDAQLWNDLFAVRDAGVPVIATVGGPSSRTWELLQESFDTYYTALSDTVGVFARDGVVLDVRTPVPDELVVRLIDAFRHDFGPGFSISLAAPASALGGGSDPATGLDYAAIYRARSADISWLDLRFFCDAPAPGAAEYLGIVAHQRSAGAGIPAEKLVMSALTRPDLCPGTTAAYVDPATLARQLQGIVAVEPRFGGVAGWQYAGALPGGASASWRWTQLMSAALASPLPLPVDPGAAGDTPPDGPGGQPPAGQLAASGAAAPVGAAGAAGGMLLAGLLLVAFRPGNRAFTSRAGAAGDPAPLRAGHRARPARTPRRGARPAAR